MAKATVTRRYRSRKSQKDFWEKADIIGKLLTPVVIAFVGFYLTYSTQQTQTKLSEAIAETDKKNKEATVTSTMLTHLISADPHQRKMAIAALRKGAPDKTYEDILQVMALNDNDQSVRTDAVRQLAIFNAKSSIEFLYARYLDQWTTNEEADRAREALFQVNWRYSRYSCQNGFIMPAVPANVGNVTQNLLKVMTPLNYSSKMHNPAAGATIPSQLLSFNTIINRLKPLEGTWYFHQFDSSTNWYPSRDMKFILVGYSKEAHLNKSNRANQYNQQLRTFAAALRTKYGIPQEDIYIVHSQPTLEFRSNLTTISRNFTKPNTRVFILFVGPLIGNDAFVPRIKTHELDDAGFPINNFENYFSQCTNILIVLDVDPAR